MSDPLTDRLRRRIAEQDRVILRAVNRRLQLVAELKEHKARAGVEFVDSDQERRLVDALEQRNAGPLSPAGLRHLFREILALTKRELS